jgi:hypothetical protein
MHFSAPALAVRLVDQALDAAALSYALAHGAALAARLDTARTLVALAIALAATYAVLARCRAPLDTLVASVQRYATYLFAFVLRVHVGALFGTSAHALSITVFVLPLAAAALVAFVAALAAFYGVWLRVDATRMRSPLAITERFIEAIAFAYGLAGAPRGRLVDAALALVVASVACAVAQQRVRAWHSETLRAFVLYLILFVESYVLYASARLIYASALVRGGALAHGAPLERLWRGTLLDSATLLVLIIIAVALSTLADVLFAAPTTEAAAAPILPRTGRRVVDRFVDAIIISAALAHASVLARAVSFAPLACALAALIFAAYVVECAASSSAVPLARAVAALAALVSRYASYALVQATLARGAHAAAAASLAALAADLATPLVAVALLVLVRQKLVDALSAHKRERAGAIAAEIEFDFT